MLNIAIAGLGTVGAGVVRLLQDNADIIAARAGQPVMVKAVSARDRHRSRPCNVQGIKWVDNPLDFVSIPGVDAVVELIGGAEGAARGLAEATLASGRHYVTANKALLAAHGASLSKLAEAHNVQLLFEASVAGGIPVIKALREGLAGNRISVIRGILNGTCNYILTRMQEVQLTFAEALAEAQTKGYAEADPAADIDGHDAANKLAILAALAFGGEPDLASIQVDGIRRVTPVDFQFADQLDCRIKLLGVARYGSQGLEQRVGVSLVAKTSPLAEVDGVLNAVLLRGDFIGELTLEGRGAGAEPTASAVVADIIDLARGHRIPAFGVKSGHLQKLSVAKNIQPARYYVRLQVMDKPGVVADISAILRDEAISIESLLQRGKSATQSVPVVITTHEADGDAMRRAIKKIAGLGTIVEPPCVMPIED